jgi:hypothetical protein
VTNKKITIIAFAYPPSTLIAGQRTYSWATELAALGNDVTVLTRHWQGNEKKPADVERSDKTAATTVIENGVTVIRLPYYNDAYNKRIEESKKGGLLSKLKGIQNDLSYHTYINPYNYDTLKNYIGSFFADHPQDAVVISCPPFQYIRLGWWIKKKFGTKLWIDMRDYLFLYDTIENTVRKGDLLQQVRNKYFAKQTRKYIKAADVVSGISEGIIRELEPSASAKEKVILNGYDDTVEQICINDQPTEKFTISILGTLYPGQDIDFMLEGFSAFIKGKETTILINFIGSGSDAQLQDKIKASINFPGLHISAWQPRRDALQTVSGSNILYYIGWPGVKGVYSGKVFEYLGARKNILVAPNDHDVVEKLITSTHSGKLADTTTEMVSILDDWYTEWQQHRKLRYHGITENISRYSRKAQASVLVQELDKLLADHS